MLNHSGGYPPKYELSLAENDPKARARSLDWMLLRGKLELQWLKVSTTVALLLLLTLIGVIAHQLIRQSVLADAQQRLINVAAQFEVEVDKYKFLTRHLAFHSGVLSALQQPKSGESLNLILEQLNAELGSDVIFLINPQGNTIGSSNWRQEDSFIGENYSFRPYFSEALGGESFNFFALGTKSGKRGYFFSHAVQHEGRVIAVLVVKVDLVQFEHSISEQLADFVVTDPSGVVFFSSSTTWNYHSLIRLRPELQIELQQSRQYGANPLTALSGVENMSELMEGSTVYLPDRDEVRAYYQSNMSMPKAGWLLFILTPVSKVYVALVFVMLAVCLLILLISAMLLSWYKTKMAQRQLATVNENLELLVQGRTAELTSSNLQLQDMLVKYQQTELSLQQTQNELIQAAKLAMLGEMAASVNHELNQPLTAMRIYVENLRLLHRKQAYEQAAGNLEEVVKLIDRMSKIIGQYKLFARKSAGKIGPVALSEVIQTSMSILANKLDQVQFDLSCASTPQPLLVMADAIPLEQVLLNLLDNACYAALHNASPKVWLAVFADGEHVTLEVKDNGPGLSSEQIQHVFEPFFTTKENGLGLGLAISKRIIDSFDGAISVSSSTDGAVFKLVLERFDGV